MTVSRLSVASRERLAAARFGSSLLLVLIGCNSQQPPPTPARFEQPNAVDFVCVNNGTVVALNKCNVVTTTDDTLVLHALVTQHSRGEVASVDLEQHTVFDSRRDIPGYTFVPVGQLPIAIVVPPEHPQLTYVADFGSSDVRVLKTLSLVTPLSGTAEVQNVPLMVPSDAGPVPASPTHMVLTPDEGALLLTIPEQGRVLWLPIQRCNVPSPPANCQDGMIDTAGIASIALEGSADRIVADDGAAPDEAPYEKLCGAKRAQPAAAAPIELKADQLKPAPRPSGLAIDAYCHGAPDCKRRVLVSDEALPLIHAIDLDAIKPASNGSDALLPPVVVGVAQKAVAVTPRVPVALGSDEETQYVYAIDAVDGSVLVSEHGRVLNVNADPNARADRIVLSDVFHFGSPPAATALAVLTPWFNVNKAGAQYIEFPGADNGPVAPAKYCLDADHTEENPARLRGVFLAIATADGTVRIVDVHDMELFAFPSVDSQTHQKSAACRVCPAVPIPAAVRNQERLAANFIVEAGDDQPLLAPIAQQFSFVIDSLPFNIRPDGTNGSPQAPRLACIKCDRGLSTIFPSASDEAVDTEADAGTSTEQDSCSGAAPALLCAGTDPWIANEEQWLAIYEGSLPGSSVGNGRFITPKDADNRTGSPEVVGRLDFCALGALGDDTITAEDTGTNCSANADAPTGDQLVVTSLLLDSRGAGLNDPEAAITKNCAAARAAIQDDPTLLLAFEIRRAYRDRVVIGERLLTPIGGLETYTDVQRCLGNDPISFDVRTRKSFAVIGESSGFQHRVKADASGRCVVDTTADPLRRARARLGCTFQNHTFEFRPLKPGPDDAVQVPPGGLTLQILMSAGRIKLYSNLASLGFGTATVVPVQLRYSDVDHQLYMVDIQDRGLVPMSLDPFAASVDPSETFN